MSVTQILNWFVRMSSDRESQIVAVERVVEYADIDSEAPATNDDYRPPDNWPQVVPPSIIMCR